MHRIRAALSGSGPSGGSIKGAVAIVGLAGLGYAFSQALYNVEGGKRAVVYNRIVGVKDKIFSEGSLCRVWLCVASCPMFWRRRVAF